MSTEDKRIRELAHQIWESEGKPHGEDARHWEMARKLAEAEALTPSKSPKAAAKAKPKAKPAAAAPKPAAKPSAVPAAKKPAAKKPKAP
jgi:Rod binding domain-containing protein